MNQTITEYINTMPKIDLHCHLDGSLSPYFIKSTLNLPNDANDLLSKVQAPETCNSLTEYLTCFDLPIQALQTYNSIKTAVLDVIKQARDENINYIELRFAPAFSINSELKLSDICEAAIEGCKEGFARYQVYSNIILCAMRHLDFQSNLNTLYAVREYLGYGICALDLAGDESMYPNELFIDLFKEARRLNVPFTIHSGECGSSENVKLALSFGASRIGHGIALAAAPSLIADIKKAHIGLELCPTSNLQTKAVKSLVAYPLKYFLDSGLMATINTDNRTVSNTTMTRELTLAYEKLGINEELIKEIYRNSVEISFACDSIKNSLLKLI